MDIRQLKYFLAVVDHNGFSRAAEHLLVAQPSLSQAIAGFERELGMPLFHRIGRGVVLSEAGSRAGRSGATGNARSGRSQSHHARPQGAARRPARPSHHALARHGTTHNNPHQVLPAHPDVTVNAEAAFTPEEVLALVRTGSAEIGVLGSADPTVAADLDVVALERQALVLISGPDDDGPTTNASRARTCPGAG